jgi:zinc finger protein
VRSVLPNRCPICENEIEFVYETDEIPYFSQILLVTSNCECGFRYSDVILLNESEPVRWEIHVDEPDDLMVRVVRSSRGVLEIPELGVKVEPGTACEGFITNVEGVLNRVENVLQSVLTWAEGDERINACALMEKIEDVKKGEVPITLILEDCTGNSAIISEKAEKTLIEETGAEEAASSEC